MKGVYQYTSIRVREKYRGSLINDTSPRGRLHLGQAEHHLDLDKRLYLAKAIVQGIQNSMAFTLSRWGVNPVKLNSIRVEGKTIEELMGKEAELWTHFYLYFGRVVGVEDFKRTRRPPEDEINAMISYANSVLYGLALSSAIRTGLDPAIGFLHAVNNKGSAFPST